MLRGSNSKHPGCVRVGFYYWCVGCVTIPAILQSLIYYAANDALGALERNTITRPVVGVDVGDTHLEQVLHQGRVVSILTLGNRYKDERLHPAKHKRQCNDEQ